MGSCRLPDTNMPAHALYLIICLSHPAALACASWLKRVLLPGCCSMTRPLHAAHCAWPRVTTAWVTLKRRSSTWQPCSAWQQVGCLVSWGRAEMGRCADRTCVRMLTSNRMVFVFPCTQFLSSVPILGHELLLPTFCSCCWLGHGMSYSSAAPCRRGIAVVKACNHEKISCFTEGRLHH